MTAALTHISCVKNSSVLSQPENCPSVSDVVLISGGRLFHANGPATEKLRGLWTEASCSCPRYNQVTMTY